MQNLPPVEGSYPNTAESAVTSWGGFPDPQSGQIWVAFLGEGYGTVGLSTAVLAKALVITHQPAWTLPRVRRGTRFRDRESLE